MGLIEKQSAWFLEKFLFLWLPIMVIALIIKKWRAERAKKTEGEE